MHKPVTSRHVDHPPCILAGTARYVGEGCGGIDRQQEDLMEQVDSFFFLFRTAEKIYLLLRFRLKPLTAV